MSDVSATPYGLTAQEDLYYDFHFAGRGRMWELLKRLVLLDAAVGVRQMQQRATLDDVWCGSALLQAGLK